MTKNFYDISVIGIVGLPALYGGFETLAEHLSSHIINNGYRVLIFCSAKSYSKVNRKSQYNGCDLEYINLRANGWQSIIYDIVSIWKAAKKTRTLLILGVSGCLVLPIVRLFFPYIKIVTNIDGIEWKRRKWGVVTKIFLKISESFAVKYSHKIIADNYGIAEYVQVEYGKKTYQIAYGGNQSENKENKSYKIYKNISNKVEYFNEYFLTVCRIEPENNIEEILIAFSKVESENIIIIGNWESSSYSKKIYSIYGMFPNIKLLSPIYDQDYLKIFKENAKGYIHGHSAGGTNPSLVEAMHSKLAILAFDVSFNRYTTSGKAIYWSNSSELAILLKNTKNELLKINGQTMKKISQENYTWDKINDQYLKVLL